MSNPNFALPQTEGNTPQGLPVWVWVFIILLIIIIIVIIAIIIWYSLKKHYKYPDISFS
jgi:hypothetical protein